MKEPVVFCWSGGKDSALALYKLKQDARYQVVGLITTCNAHFQRVSMHGVRIELVERQAASIGLPLAKIFVSQRSSNEEYLEKLTEQLLVYKAEGVMHLAYGDIFLEDLKRWREDHLARIGLGGLFPIWKKDSRQLIDEFLALGFGSIICCVNDAYLDQSALGRKLDASFVGSLPAGIDPCGENGEFHSFAFAGPIFRESLRVKVGEKVYRPVEQTHPGSMVSAAASQGGARQTRGFWFCDLLPDDE